MKTPHDNHTVSGSLLMRIEFIVIHTIIWGFLLGILFYALSLFLSAFYYLPVINILTLLYFSPPLYFIRLLFKWPGVMLTALIITVIRSIYRKTTVTMTDGTITIRRLRFSEQFSLSDFVRPETKESFINVHFVGWVFRRRWLVFRDDAGKEIKYRLYEFSQKDLDRVMQLITRVDRTERLAENDKTQIMIDTFQNALEIPLNPEFILGRERRFLFIILLCALPAFVLFSYIVYRMFYIPEQYDSASLLLSVLGFGSLYLALGSFLLLCLAAGTLLSSTAKSKSCPEKITFTGNMLQIDNNIYSVNRILKIYMTRPDKKPARLYHYQIKIVTTEGTHRYWLGSVAVLNRNTWLTICRNMQNILISCPAKLIYK